MTDARIRARVESFGFLHGVPQMPATVLVADLREQLRDPHVDPALRERNGLDSEVRHKVLTTPGAVTVLEEITGRAITLFHGWDDPRFRMVHVLIGCQGGRHRSVVLAEEVAAQLTEHGIRAAVTHHHIDRPVVKR